LADAAPIAANIAAFKLPSRNGFRPDVDTLASKTGQEALHDPHDQVALVREPIALQR
jgi:hypothetical protein